MNKQIIFVDSSVEDYQILAQNAAEGSKVVILDNKSSAIEQITQSLVGESDIEALHILSHGDEGSITLGTEVINETAIETFRDRLKEWGKALTKTGDILLYGCNVAAGEIGQKFVKKLSEFTGAAVAASNNLTGAAALGGDWNLEVRFGEVETQPLSFANYGYTLATITNVTSSLATGTYKAGQLVPITVTFSGNVDVASAAGFPGFTLNTGGTAFYTGVGSGTNTLNFNYIVATGENNADLNYTSLALNGTIYDAGTTTPATLTLPASTGPNSLGTNTVLAIDAKAPTVTSIVRKTPTASAINTTTTSVTYTVTFDEPVNSLDATDFTVTQVSGAATTTPPVVVAATTASNTVDVTVNGIAGADGVFRLDVPATATINDAVANALTTAFTSGETYSRDGTAPLATNITSATADGSYTTTTTIPITVTFNEAVNVTGSPTLTLDTGGTATYTSGTGTNTLTFNYTPAAGNTSADLNATAIAGTIADIAGNAYALALPATTLAATKALVIDTTAPTVALTSAAAATVTAPFTVTATFTEASGSVTGFTAADITVANGTASTPTGGPLVYTFTVTPTTDGLVTVNIPANGATDAATNGNTVATALTRTADLPPTITNVSSSLTDGSYGTVAVGTYTGTVPITVTFSKAVNVTGTPTLALSTGGTATYASGGGSSNLIFNYTPAAGQTSADLDYTATTALTGGTIASLAGTAAVTTLPAPAAAGSLGANKALVIDTTAPTITSVTSTTADGTYGLTTGPINVTVNFSEPVTSTGPITVTLDSGATVSIPAITTSSATAVGSYTPANPQTSADLNSTAIAGTLKDAASNAATLTIPAGQSLKDSKAIVVDTIVPTVALTTAAVSPVTGLFSVTATFSESVGTTFDATDLTVGNGTASNFVATATPGVYTFDIKPTADGPVTIDVPANKATDAALNPNTAAPTLLVTANVPPKVTSITSTLADGSYPLGQVVPITVTFSEPVIVTGTPTLTLNSGGTASYASGSTTNTLTFNYTVGTGQNTLDLDYTAITSLVVPAGAAITDAVVTTSPADVTLPAPAAINSLGANKALVIDTIPPTVTINQASSQVDPTKNTLINYTVVFSEPVKNFDATDLTFTGITGAAATVTGDGTGQNYNVAVTGLTQPGTLTTTVKASGATDLAGNGNDASTSTDNSVTFTPVTPYVTAINKLDADPTTATTVNYTVTFNEAVTGVDAADFTLVTTGVTGATIGTITGSGTTYTVPVNTGTLDGTVQLDLVDNNTIINALNAPLGGTALSDGNFKGQIYTIGKNVAPVVATTITDQSAALNTAFSYVVPAGTFTDANNDTLTYTAIQENGSALPTWLTFDPATRTFSGTPATADIGNLKIEVIANDGQATASNTFLLAVSNTAPVVASVINDQSATPSTAFTYTVPTGTFTDANKDTLTYTATKDDGTALPTWLTFNAATQTFSGTPAATDLGVVQVKVVASDGLASANDTFLLTVSNKPNTAPVVATAITDKTTNIDTAFNFTVPTGTFTDAESDPLTYTATQENGSALPTWLTFNAATLAFSGTPGQANVGNTKVKLTANDGKASTSDVFQIVVNGPAPFTPAPAPAPAPSPSGGGTTTTTTVGGSITINTPPISLIDRGQPTNQPQNQSVNGQYLLSDGDDSSIPTSAFGQPIRGLSGNDNLTGSSNGDTIFGDRGADIINGGDGNDSLFGGKESDQLSGGNGDDFLSGNNENDTLTGGAGNDILRGGKENDVLLGGDGDDQLWGDRGFDALTGGAGKDNFVLEFTATSADQADVITDFTVADDKIRLVGFTFSQLSFESVSVVLDGATAVTSTAIKSGNNYLGVVYNVNSSALSSASFV